MKRLVYLFCVLVSVYSCNTYDDAWIKEELKEHSAEIGELESKISTLDDNISNLKSILHSLEEMDVIESISAIKDGDEIKGYKLTFQKIGAITLSMGKAGEKGQNGENASKPLISVRQDSDGEWYWTINGEWQRDKDGNKVPAISNDDVTPSFKIEDGYWYVSFDDGESWDFTGRADGKDGDMMFSDIKYDGHYCYLTLSDGTIIEIPMLLELEMTFGEVSTEIEPSSTFTVDYEIIGGNGKAKVTCIGEHGWLAKSISTTERTGKISITSPDVLKDGKVIVFVSEADVTLTKALVFDVDEEEYRFMSSKYDYYEIDGTGGFIDVQITTNDDYSINIPEDAKSWVNYISTRSVREDNLRFGIKPNPSAMPAREARITFSGQSSSAQILIYQKASPFIDDEVDLGLIDGFDNPEEGIKILQQASIGNGTDIIIMGDGYSKKHFIPGGEYESTMRKAYEDFFSVEPYASLKEYFNVYYINVLSEEEHDAKPYYDSYGNQNGAIQGNADTKLGTTFTPGSTSMDGDSQTILEYAIQTIEKKGGADGGQCSYSEASERAYKALIIVMANVECYAGTCLLSWRSSSTIDYANLYSIAYCSLGNDGTGRQCKYTLIHEAGGHGFGKLADEYSVSRLLEFNTREWINLQNYHKYGVYRNVNEYWTAEIASGWGELDWPYTTESNVYWSELLDPSYGYISSEGLGLYEGAYTYTSLFCRSTANSMMNSQLRENGQFFNAISRWAIWYRTMRLTETINSGNFKSSLSEFIEFDSTLNIIKNNTIAPAQSGVDIYEDFQPLGPPVLLEYE